MIRRTTASVILGMVAWLVLSAPLAVAQSSSGSTAREGSDAVVVQVGDVDPAVEPGVLVRTGDASMAPISAAFAGLAIVSATLAAITARRRTIHVRAVERVTGLVAGRRDRTGFWDLPASPGTRLLAGRTPTPGPRLPAAAGLPSDPRPSATARPAVPATNRGRVDDGIGQGLIRTSVGPRPPRDGR